MAPGRLPRPAVLVVEDDPDVATTINDVVEERGYRAICVGNGREALSALEAERPALMLVDLFMPVMNGAEFLKVVKRTPKLASIPRVIMTAANDPMIGVREDVTVLYKPVDFDALNRLLVRYCESPQAQTR
jgi:CheY-like chemotaxis protein